MHCPVLPAILLDQPIPPGSGEASGNARWLRNGAQSLTFASGMAFSDAMLKSPPRRCSISLRGDLASRGWCEWTVWLSCEASSAAVERAAQARRVALVRPALPRVFATE